MKGTGVVGMLFVAAIAFAGCLGGDNETVTSPSPSPTGMMDHMNMTHPLKTLSVTATDAPPTTMAGMPYGWSPKTFSVALNDSINIVLRGGASNTGSHNLVITELGVSITGVGANQMKNVTVMASQKGTFNYFCNLGMGATAHRALGMTGSLTIT